MAKVLESSLGEAADLSFPPRKVWLKTFGCQMNLHDSERILARLRDINFSQTDEINSADLVIFNTCAIRELSNQKFYSQLGALKKAKGSRSFKIAVGGCVAQTEGAELISRFPHLDFAFGTDVIDSISDMVAESFAGATPFSVTKWDRAKNYSIETQITHGRPQAFINIIKGCDKFCSYCIVPFTRGREKSRRIDEIASDVQSLVEKSGVQEVTLLGQNVNSFGKENNESLAKLLYRLEEIPGLALIRYTTSHPYDVSDELIEAHGKCSKLSNHLHLPVQSGSNSVLQRMLRQYTREHYLGLLKKLRTANPNLVISTDIIAGFPNETRQEHRETLDLLEMARFDFIYSFVFSPRKGTKAARIEDFITSEIRSKRLQEIQALQKSIQTQDRQSMIGQHFLALIEGKQIMNGRTTWKARTSCYRIVHLPLEEHGQRNLLWNWVEVQVKEVSSYSAQGEIIKNFGRHRPGPR